MSRNRILLASLISAVLCSTSVYGAGMAVWDRSSNWLCKAEKIRLCAGPDVACRVEPGQAVFQINFDKNTFRPFGTEDEFVEHFVFKKYKDRSENTYSRDTHYAALDGGARVLIFGRPDDSLVKQNAISAKFISADDEDVITHFLRCAPSD